jgi:serine protease Do
LTVASTPLDTGVAAALSHAFRQAAARALPSVAYISVVRQAPNVEQAVPDPFHRFFQLPEGYERPPQRGTGSGFVMDEDGHLLTNHHVVAGADEVLVRFPDGREFRAEVLASDVTTDLAVLRTTDGERHDLPAAESGDSDELQVGDWVLALGNPLGLDFTVTAGIVSAKGRQLTGSTTTLEAYVQTDAAINPGNSGGPLIDLYGRVMGINTAISGAPMFVGYGFAVPINLAKRVVRDLLEYGYVRRPRLGVSVSDVTAVDAEAYGLDEVRGAEINTVEDGSPADEAGLEIGDVVIALDDEPIVNATALVTGLVRRQPGDRITLAIIRHGRRSTVSVRLGEFPRAEVAEGPRNARTRGGPLGFEVQPLTLELARQHDLDAEAGVVVSYVVPYDAAATAGIRPGQLVLRINDKAVTRVDDVEAIARTLKSGSVVSLRVRDPTLGETIVNYRLRP